VAALGDLRLSSIDPMPYYAQHDYSSNGRYLCLSGCAAKRRENEG